MKYLYASITIVLCTLSILLFQRKETPFILISSPHIYSLYHSDNLDTFTLSLLTNHPDHYYVDGDYISTAKITNNTDVFPIEITRISISDSAYQYNEEAFYTVHFIVQVQLFYEDKLIQIDEASLQLDYTNGESLMIPIGDWNYRFLQSPEEDLTFHTLLATYEVVDQVETVSGITIELVNRTNDIITIDNISLLTNHVVVDAANITETSCEGHITVSECIGRPYSFTVTPLQQDFRITLLGGQSKTFYLPLKYHDVPYFHQGAMELNYQIHGNQRTMMIDDFPYLKTSIFQADYEGYYHVLTSTPDS